jgi:hypothetical protein
MNKYRIFLITIIMISIIMLMNCTPPGGQGAEGDSLWNVNGTNIYYTEGNVGIGTNNPTTALEVAGMVTIGAYTLPITDGTAGYVLKTDGSGSVTWEEDSGGAGADNLGNHTATVNIQMNGHWLSNDGGNEGVYVDASGNVGIGTSNPDGALLNV